MVRWNLKTSLILSLGLPSKTQHIWQRIMLRTQPLPLP